MSRNVESRFSLAPSLNVGRSSFEMNNTLKTSFNVGDVIPMYLQEVLPGDTMKVKTNKVIRLQSMLTPIMDNLYVDTYYFFVPNRLVWSHWKEFMGENTESAWLPETEYEIPQTEAPENGWNIGTLADYFGLPTGVDNISVSSLPFRAYAKIIDDWFRDQNLMDPIYITLGDSTTTGTNGTNYITDIECGGAPFIAAKYHDYFSSALPAPQKGPDVTISIGEISGKGNVFGNGYALGITNGTALGGLTEGSNASLMVNTELYGKAVNTFNNSVNAISGNYSKGVPTKTQLGDHPEYSGLETELNISGASIVTINQLRQAFQIQKFYEKDARGGTRYIEIIKQHFGVTSPDARLQRSEYLGGCRVPITVNQVLQTSETGSTPQGTPTGQSLTVDSHFDFNRSFTEHGYILGLMVVRYDHTYQQGIARHWRRKDKFDYYWPVFANLGEQAILNSEIYAQGSDVVNAETGKAYDDEVFGYQEAWADYRYKPSYVTGEMRSAATASLDSWHLGDDYNSLPSLSAAWIREDKSNVDRTLAVTSAVSHQLFADIYIQNSATRPMPVYSYPGLMDHH